jgi:WD40 repeat protein
VLRDDGRQPFAFAVSADGRRAAETFAGDSTLVWDLEANDLIAEVPPTTPFQARPALSPDGRLLAIANFEEAGGGREQSISIWHVADATELLRIPYPGNARYTTFSPDGRRLAVADMQNAVVRLYNVAAGDLVEVFGDPRDARGVDSVAFDPTGERIAMFVFTPREIRIVEVETGEVVRSIPLGTAALGGRLCYSRDGSVLAVATQDELLEVYESSGAPLASLPGSAAIESLVCGENEQTVGLATEEGLVRVWGLTAADANEVLSIAAPAPFTGAWTPDGAAIVTTHYGGALLPGEAEQSETGTLHRYDPKSGELLSHTTDLHPFPPWWVAISPNGRYVAVNANPFGDVDAAQAAVDVPRNARLVIYDTATLDVVRELEPAGWPIGFAPDSSRFLAGAADRAFVFDVASGRVVARLSPPGKGTGEAPEVGGGGFLPDGRHVVLVTGNTREGWVLDIETGEVAATFCASGEHFQSALSHDGQYLAVGSGPRTVDVWDLETLLETGGADCDGDSATGRVATLGGEGVVALEFGPDGESLAGAGFDGVLTLWDAPSGEVLLRIEHPGPIGGASFSPEGNHVMVTVNDAEGGQHAVRIYTLDVDELVGIARKKVTRQLTDDECRSYLQLAACP